MSVVLSNIAARPSGNTTPSGTRWLSANACLRNGGESKTNRLVLLAAKAKRDREVIVATYKHNQLAMFSKKLLENKNFIALMLFFFYEQINRMSLEDLQKTQLFLYVLGSHAENNLSALPHLLNCTLTELQRISATEIAKAQEITAQYTALVSHTQEEHARIRSAISGDILTILSCLGSEGDDCIDLNHALKENKILIFEFESKQSKTQSVLGKLISFLLKDAMEKIIHKQSNEIDAFVLFSHCSHISGFAVMPTQMRSVGIAACFAYSSLEQMDTLCGSKNEAQSIIANCNVRLFQTNNKWQLFLATCILRLKVF